ncbi:MAG TPA: CPXCG motif-containing cysteine-rich protein [Acidobacteriota bacterium]|jgi:hypothetical protein
MQETAEIECPHCGEWLEICLDPSLPFQIYIEDCQICCKPIQIRVVFEQGEARVHTEAVD